MPETKFITVQGRKIPTTPGDSASAARNSRQNIQETTDKSSKDTETFWNNQRESAMDRAMSVLEGKGKEVKILRSGTGANNDHVQVSIDGKPVEWEFDYSDRRYKRAK